MCVWVCVCVCVCVQVLILWGTEKVKGSKNAL